jgi:hypothetical protein
MTFALVESSLHQRHAALDAMTFRIVLIQLQRVLRQSDNFGEGSGIARSKLGIPGLAEGTRFPRYGCCRCDLQMRDIPSNILNFIERYEAASPRQLTLRLL